MKIINNNLHFSNINSFRIVLFIGILAFCFITGGLFSSSQTDETSLKRGNTLSAGYGFYYTPTELPETLDFAGEPVPLENFDVKEALDRELLSCAYFHSQTLLFLKKLPRYFHIIEPILKKNEIPDDFKYLALAESSFLDKAVSPAGAIGIWQFMKSSAQGYGLEVNNEVDERY